MVQNTREAFMTVFPSALGWMAAAWRGGDLLGLTFNHAGPQAAMGSLTASLSKAPQAILLSDCVEDEPTGCQAELIARLQAFAAGADDEFLDVPLDLAEHTAFQRRVIHYCRRIGPGKVLTYGELAAKAGSPGAARAVGHVMATNRWPLIVPCHRVVGAGGGLGGYSAPDGLAIKRRLLEREGWLPASKAPRHGKGATRTKLRQRRPAVARS
jgi:methylated-DNA-[protein]-cysteine S-methyltransferase